VNSETDLSAIEPPTPSELFALELRWYEGRMLPYADWLMVFLERHRAEILALAAGSREAGALVAATKQLIVQRGTLHLAGELKDQVGEIEKELWYCGERGDRDRARIQQEWTAAHAVAWRRWRIKEYLFVADRCVAQVLERLSA
jgi:hypothetical protein